MILRKLLRAVTKPFVSYRRDPRPLFPGIHAAFSGKVDGIGDGALMRFGLGVALGYAGGWGINKLWTTGQKGLAVVSTISTALLTDHAYRKGSTPTKQIAAGFAVGGTVAALEWANEIASSIASDSGRLGFSNYGHSVTLSPVGSNTKYVISAEFGLGPGMSPAKISRLGSESPWLRNNWGVGGI